MYILFLLGRLGHLIPHHMYTDYCRILYRRYTRSHLLCFPSNLRSDSQIHYMSIKHHYHNAMNLLHKKKPVRKLILLTKSLVINYMCVCVCVCVEFCGFQLDKFYWHIFLLFPLSPEALREGGIVCFVLPLWGRGPRSGEGGLIPECSLPNPPPPCGHPLQRGNYSYPYSIIF